MSYLFINRGAYSRTYDHDIRIKGLRLICNGQETLSVEEGRIPGLRGHLTFFYIRNLVIEDFECLDLLHASYCIHICTFENIRVENLRIEGFKDAVHLGRGDKFVIRHGIFKTFDDPIALNAHDYSSGNPQLGWIENGIVEDCYDLNAESTTGYFCRILAGAWVDWFPGMRVQQSDTVVSCGRLYRVLMSPNGVSYVSSTRPEHTEGIRTLDGIDWVMVQDDVTYNCGCRNVHFKDIFLQKKRDVAFSIHFDDDRYSRSVYPGAEMPVQEDLIFENIFFQNEIPCLISAITPVNAVKVVNAVMRDSRVELKSLPREGLQYGVANVLMAGVTFKGKGGELVRCLDGRRARLRLTGSLPLEADFRFGVSEGVEILSSDL